MRDNIISMTPKVYSGEKLRAHLPGAEVKAEGAVIKHDNIVSVTPELVPGEKLRTYPPDAEIKARRHADMLEAILELSRRYCAELLDGQDAGDREDYDPVITGLAGVCRRLVHAILYDFDLVGLEYRDEHGRLLGVIRAVLDPDMDAPEPLDPCVKYGPIVCFDWIGFDWIDWFRFVKEVSNGRESLRLPGSKQTGYQALIEAVRIRTGERAP